MHYSPISPTAMFIFMMFLSILYLDNSATDGIGTPGEFQYPFS